MTSSGLYNLQLAVSILVAAGPVLLVILPHLLLLGRDPFRTGKSEQVISGQGWDILSVRSGRGRWYKITATGPGPDGLELTRLGWRHGLARRLGVLAAVSGRVRTRDLRLAVSPATATLPSGVWADLAASLLILPGATRLQSDATGLALYFSLPARLELKPEILHQAGEDLTRLREILFKSGCSAAPASRGVTALSLKSLALCVTLSLIGAGALLLGQNRYESLDHSIYPDLFVYGVPVALAAAALTLAGLRKLTARTVSGSSLFGAWIPALPMTYLLLFMGGYYLGNGILDRSELTIRNLPILGHYIETGKGGGRRILAVPVTGESASTRMRLLIVSEELFARTREGDRLIVLTRAGAFGHTWIQSLARD